MSKYKVEIPDSVDRYDKTIELITKERQDLLQQKKEKTQEKIDTYLAAQEYQKQNGGPGPTADFEIMKIVNEHDCEFVVVWT